MPAQPGSGHPGEDVTRRCPNQPYTIRGLCRSEALKKTGGSGEIISSFREESTRADRLRGLRRSPDRLAADGFFPRKTLLHRPVRRAALGLAQKLQIWFFVADDSHFAHGSVDLATVLVIHR
ncbi:MAG: hypothetical protein WCJ31_04285 [Planctomycetia bacterium]